MNIDKHTIWWKIDFFASKINSNVVSFKKEEKKKKDLSTTLVIVYKIYENCSYLNVRVRILAFHKNWDVHGNSNSWKFC